MKKILITLLTIFMIFTLSACGNKKVEEPSGSNNETQQNENTEPSGLQKEENKIEESNSQGETQQTTLDDEYIDDNDEIVEYDDTDNGPIEEETVVVEKVINCDGCVYAYFNAEGDQAKKIGDTLSPSEYTTDIRDLKTMGSKQRHNFFGLVLSGNTISKAYACIWKDKKIYCLQGSTDGSYFTNNIGVLNQVFTSGQCKYISNGHTYTCTDGDYNGDTVTTGYTSMHYETSCTIYGKDSNTGKLICH